MTELTDENLVQGAINGDPKCFEEIVSKYEKLIYSICYRMFNNNEDALDATQETFIKVYKNMEKAIGKGNFKSWICTIATNTCLDELRKRSKKHTVSIDEPIDGEGNSIARDIVDDGLTPLESIVADEKTEVLKNAINKLSDENKMIIVLRDIEGLSYDDIAETLDISLGTVKSRISRARKKLHQIYLEDMQLLEK